MGLLEQNGAKFTNLRWVTETGSTNQDLLLDLAQGDASDDAVLVASKQNAGRGRQGRSWITGTGSVAVSYAKALSNLSANSGWLPLLTAVAVKKVVESNYDREISVKWPNDCLVDGKKVAGILVERNQEFEVIGLGINISSAPEIETATSLGLSDQVVIVADLLVEIKNAANQIQILTDKEIQEFISPLISTIGKNVEVTNLDGSVTIGYAVGIGLNGALLLSEGTSTIEILSGDVKHLRDADER